MIDRRGFLKLFASSTIIASTNPVHFLAPVGGWRPIPLQALLDIGPVTWAASQGYLQHGNNWKYLTAEDLKADSELKNRIKEIIAKNKNTEWMEF